MRKRIRHLICALFAIVIIMVGMPSYMHSSATEASEPETQTTTEEAQTTEEVQADSLEEAVEPDQSEPVKFEASAGDVDIMLQANAGVFPEDSTLSVEKISKAEQKKVDKAIEAEKKEGQTVAASYTFDIKVLDAEGNEVQPAEGSTVALSFRADQVSDENLNTRVFHIDENRKNLDATELEVSSDGDTATVETDSFSYYTVEFTYGDKQFVLEGDGVVKLDDLLKSIGIEGEVKGTKVSNRELFDVIRGTKDGVRYITTFANGKTRKVPTNDPDGKVRYVVSYKPFQTEEWMDVTMTDGITHHIIVTDAIINDGADTENIPGVAQGIYPTHTQNIPLGDIWIDDAVLNETPECRNRATFEKGDLMTEIDPETGKLKNPGFIIYDTEEDTGTGHSCYGGSTGARYFVEFNTHEQPLSGEIETKVTNTGETVYQSYNYFEGVIGTYKWENAAVRLGEDGHEEKLDVFIEYSNPLITFQHDDNTQHVPEINDRWLGLFSGNMMTIGQTADDGAADIRYGLVMDIKPYVKDKQGNIVSGNFYYPMTDIDVLRTPYKNFRTFYQADDRNENYDETTNRYSETVFIDHEGVYTNSRGESLFIPGAEGDARNYLSRITNTHSEYVVYPGSNGGDRTPSQYTGFTLLAKNDDFTVGFMGSSAGLNQTGMENYVLSGQDFNHKIRHSTSPTEGGTIQTTYEGNHSGELDDGSGVIDPNIMATSSGQTVVYTFRPKPGYTLSGVYVNSGDNCTNWPGTDRNWDLIDDFYSDKKIKEGNGLGNTYEAHDDNDDGIIDRYTYTFRNIDSDNAIHVTWQKTRLTITKRVTGNAIVDDTFKFRIRAQNTEDDTEFVDFAEKVPGTFTAEGDNWYSFTLENFETLTLDETIIPVDYKWEVEETDEGTQTGWTCIDPASKKREGQVTQNEQIQQANFLNKRNKNIDPKKSIKVKKVWKGDTEDLRPKRLAMHAYAGMSILDTGANLRQEMIRLAGSAGNIKAFKKGTEAEYKKAKDNAEIASVEEGPPTYFWYEDNTIYFYSEADVYLNEKAGGMNSGEGMFDQFKQLADISGLAYVHTDYTEDFGRMFCNCFSISSLEALQNWNTANAVNMYRMLGSGTVGKDNTDQMSYDDLQYLSEWNVEGVENMEGLFRGAKITSVAPIKEWKTTNVTNLKDVFFRSLVTDGDLLFKWNIDHVPDGNFKTFFCDKNADKYSGTTPDWAGGRWINNNRTFERTTNHDTNKVSVDKNEKPDIPAEGITLDEVYHEVQADGSWLYEFEVPDGTEELTWRVYEDLPAEYKVYYKDNEGTEHEGVGVKGDPVTGVKTEQDPIELINKRINRVLTIGKALTEKLDSEESFEFTVKFWTGSAKYKNMYDIDPIPADVEKVADGTYKFTLKTDGSSVVEQEFTDLPYGLKYEVTEDIPTGWKLIKSYHDSGVMDENRTASFLNGKNQNGIVLKLWDDHENRFDTRPVGKPDSINLELTIKNYKWKQDDNSIIDANSEHEAFEDLEAAYNDPTARDLTKLEKNIVDANDQRIILTAPKYVKYNDEPYVCDKKADTRYVAFKVDDISSTRPASSEDDDLIFEEDDELDGWYYEFPMEESERIEEAKETGSGIPYYTMSDVKETSKGLVYEITNTLNERNLIVKKEVADPADDKTTEFNFAIKFWSEVDQYTHHPVKFMHSHFVTTKDDQGQDVQEFEYLFERGVMLGEKNVEGIHEKIGDQVISKPNSGEDSDKVTMEEGDIITEALRSFTIDESNKVTDQPWSDAITMYDTGLKLSDLGLTYGGLDSFEIYVEQSPEVVNGKFENGRRIDYFLVPTGAPPFSVRTPYTGLDELYSKYGSNGTYHFALKNGTEFKFDPLPVGVFYEIVEYKDSEWNLVDSTNEKGTLPDEDTTATFTNEMKKGKVKIAKKTKYNEVGTFKFRAKIWKGEGDDIEYIDLSKQGATKVPFEDGVYEFTLNNDEEKTIENIYVNYKYEIWEELDGDWKLISINEDESKTKAEGTIHGEHIYSYTFLNKGPGLPPKAGDDKSYNLKGKTQYGTPEFEQGTAPFEKFMLIDPKTGEEVTSITIPGEGKYTVDPKTGKVTFKPEKGFVGTATRVTVRATDEYGHTADGHYTPHVVDPTEEATVKRTVKFTYEKKNGKKVVDSITQTGTIVRKATEVDPKTGKVIKWGPWSSYTFPAVKNPDKEAGPEWTTKDVAPALTVNSPGQVPDVYIVYHKADQPETTTRPTTTTDPGTQTGKKSSGSNGDKSSSTGDSMNPVIWIIFLAAAAAVASTVLVSLRRR